MYWSDIWKLWVDDILSDVIIILNRTLCHSHDPIPIYSPSSSFTPAFTAAHIKYGVGRLFGQFGSSILALYPPDPLHYFHWKSKTQIKDQFMKKIIPAETKTREQFWGLLFLPLPWESSIGAMLIDDQFYYIGEGTNYMTNRIQS